jgi:ribonuclease T1
MTRSRPIYHLLLLLLTVLLAVSGCSVDALISSTTSTVAPARTVARPTAIRATVSSRLDCTRTLLGGAEPNIPTISTTDLYRCRPEAQSVVTAIKSNGPFAYDRDDITFQNREGYLPDASNGTYREYTVETPGSSTRGARRLITSGSRNRQSARYTAMYYTDDHYETMWLVVEK